MQKGLRVITLQGVIKKSPILLIAILFNFIKRITIFYWFDCKFINQSESNCKVIVNNKYIICQ